LNNFVKSFAIFWVKIAKLRTFPSRLSVRRLEIGRLIDRRVTWHRRPACGICNCRLLHYNLARLFSCRHTYLRRAERLSIITHCVPVPLHSCLPRQNMVHGVQVARRRNAWIIVENESNLFVAKQSDWILLHRWRR